MAEDCKSNDCYEPQTNQLKDNESDGGTPATRLIQLVSPKVELYKNELGIGYVTVDNEDHKETYPIDSRYFKNVCIGAYYEAEGKPIKNEYLSQALDVFKMKAEFSEITRRLCKRVSSYNGNFYYDLANDKWEVVKISKKGYAIDGNPPILFSRSNNMKSQVLPNYESKAENLIPLTEKYFHLIKVEDKILFPAYLVACLIPDIPLPILILHGEKGASKSTTMRMIKSLIDPAQCDLLTMPSTIQNMAISFSNNYMPAYDNLQSISPEKSDMLCIASTGGSYSTRTLYTNGEETIMTFKRAIILNGISIVASRPDLLDRAILIELERIREEDRKTEKELWEEFNRDKSLITGACFDALSIAMNTVENVKLNRLGRMADFCVWAYAIAEAIGINGDDFIDAYLKNQDSANEEAIESNPLAATLIIFMKNRDRWSGSVATLLEELKDIAFEHSINANDSTFPKAAHVLSKRLKEVKSNLEKVGINYNISNAGDYKKIVITNSCFKK